MNHDPTQLRRACRSDLALGHASDHGEINITSHFEYYYRVQQSSRPLKKMLSHLHHYTALFSRLDPPAHNHHHAMVMVVMVDGCVQEGLVG